MSGIKEDSFNSTIRLYNRLPKIPVECKHQHIKLDLKEVVQYKPSLMENSLKFSLVGSSSLGIDTDLSHPEVNIIPVMDSSVHLPGDVELLDLQTPSVLPRQPTQTNNITPQQQLHVITDSMKTTSNKNASKVESLIPKQMSFL
ncbi:Uncharacterized protein QTN25_001789 [Entamoeba marina]